MEILVIFCLLAFLNLCSAQEIPCNVTHSSQWILYSVPEFQASGCHYQWANSSGHVLANHREKIDDLVLNSSVRSIATRTCMPQLNYTRDCISEGIQRVTYCVTDCRSTDLLQGEGMHRYYWGTIVGFSITALVVVVVLLRSICSGPAKNLQRINSQEELDFHESSRSSDKSELCEEDSMVGLAWTSRRK